MNITITRIDIHVHLSDNSAVEVRHLLNTLIEKVTQMAVDLTALQDEVARNTAVDESAVVLLNGLAVKIQTLTDELAAAGADVTKLQEFTDSLRGSSDALAAAVQANTPVE